MNTPETIFRTTKIMHLGIVGGLVIFMFAAIFIVNTMDGFQSNDQGVSSTMLSAIGAVLLLGAFPASRVLYQKKLGDVSTLSFEQKMGQYRIAAILQYAILDAPAMFFVLAYIFSGSWIPLAGVVLVLLVLFYLRPNADQLGKDLDLTPEQTRRLKNKD